MWKAALLLVLLGDGVMCLAEDAKTEEAIKLMESWSSLNTNTEVQKNMAQIKSDWKTLRREELEGRIDSGSAVIRRAGIVYRILNFDWSVEGNRNGSSNSGQSNLQHEDDSDGRNVHVKKILFAAANPGSVAQPTLRLS